MKRKRGGKRIKSGAKPKPDAEKKVGLTIYVQRKIIDMNGGDEICKEILISFLLKRANK